MVTKISNKGLEAFFPIIFSPRTTDPSYLLCFAMPANLVLKFLRVSSGKLTTHIILEQQAEFAR